MFNRLTNFDRGNLNAARTGISGTPARGQSWVLDQLGNWDNGDNAAFVTRVSGSVVDSRSRVSAGSLARAGANW